MGIGFVIFVHLIVIFIISIAIGTLTCIITLLFSNKEKRKQKIFFSIIAPFIAFYSLYFVGLFGSIAVSEIKNIDVGIGDSWYVPLGDKCELLFIDLPEQCSLTYNGQTVISDVSHIQQDNDMLFGKTFNEQYFSYNIKKDELNEFSNETDLKVENAYLVFEPENAWDFYSEKRNEKAGFALVVVGIISLVVTSLLVYLVRKLIFGYI